MISANEIINLISITVAPTVLKVGRYEANELVKMLSHPKWEMYTKEDKLKAISCILDTKFCGLRIEKVDKDSHLEIL